MRANINYYIKVFVSLLVVLSVQSTSFAIWEFPIFGNNTGTTKITTQTPSVVDNFLTNIGFGNRILKPVPVVQTTQQQEVVQPRAVQTDSNPSNPYQIVLPEAPNFLSPFTTTISTPTANKATPTSSVQNYQNIQSVGAVNPTLIKDLEVKADLEKQICDALIKKGVQFKAGTPCKNGTIATNPTTNTTNTAATQPANTNQTPQEQQAQNNLNSLYGQNPQNSYNQGGYTFSACAYAQNQAQCNKELQISCTQAYATGEYYLPECATQPKSIYSGTGFGSSGYYGMGSYLNDPRSQNQALMQSYLSGSKDYGVASSLLNNPYKGSLTNSPFAITGVATQYGCMNNQPDNFLISTYRYISAFGQKVRYGTNVGDSSNSCNFNYCGVAVPLPFITQTYGSKSAAKDKYVKVVNTANLKCVYAKIQDISSVKTWTHKGSNAVMDLSQCAMQALGGGGKIRVQFTPVPVNDVTEGCLKLK